MLWGCFLLFLGPVCFLVFVVYCSHSHHCGPAIQGISRDVVFFSSFLKANWKRFGGANLHVALLIGGIRHFAAFRTHVF